MKAARKPTQAEIIRERWLRGRLGYKLHSGQLIIRERYYKSEHQLFVGEIARQFGKSYLMVVEAIETAIRKGRGSIIRTAKGTKKSRGARIKYGTAFLSDLEDFIMPAFDVILEDCPEDLRPQFKTKGSKWVFPNGSEIKLVGLDRKPNGLRGNSIDLIILDEAAFMARLNYLYTSVIIPATTHRPDCRVLVFSTPPEEADHEFIELAEKAEVEGGYCRLTIYDNPLVDEKTITRLMRELGGPDSAAWKREALAERVIDEERAIVAEWRDEYWEETPRDDLFGFYTRYVAADLGVVRDFTAILFGYYDFRRACLVIEDELLMKGQLMTTEVIQKAVKEKERELWGEARSPIRRYADNNNPLLIQDLSHLHGLHFSATDKGTIAEMVNAVKMLVGSGGVRVYPRCVQTRGCLKYGLWDERRDQFAHSKTYGHFDALAALVYLVRNLDRQTNPIPNDYNADRINQIVFPRKQLSPSAQALKRGFS